MPSYRAKTFIELLAEIGDLLGVLGERSGGGLDRSSVSREPESVAGRSGGDRLGLQSLASKGPSYRPDSLCARHSLLVPSPFSRAEEDFACDRFCVPSGALSEWPTIRTECDRRVRVGCGRL